MITENAMVKFLELKNTRGYPLTGRMISTDGEGATIDAYGMYGPGTTTTLRGVPLTAIEELPPIS